MTPTPPTLATYAEIKARHAGPTRPNRCAGDMPLTTKDGECSHCGATANDMCGKWVREAAVDRATLLHHVERLAEALKECADDLSEYVEHYYESTKAYPGGLRRYERDIEPVITARALLSSLALPQEPGK